LEDARLAHNRALAEQREFLQRKLRDLASAIANEYNLTAAGAQAIAQLLNAYFGAGGVASSIFNGLQAALSSATSGAAPLISPTWAQGGLFGTGGLAEGGTFLATRPQTINVAENRPELITATPLGRAGSDVNKMFSDAGVGGGNGNGKLELAVNLSPDLEGRVIRKAMDETANVVVRINRSRT
jgi:hypothetical protein